MNITQKGHLPDGTEFKEGDILKIKTEAYGKTYTYVGVFLGFDVTEFLHKKRIILDITDDFNVNLNRMKIKYSDILSITIYSEDRNDKRGPRIRP
jgi:hypothetical protein